MAAFRLLLTCCVLLVFPMSSDSLPEPGKLKMEFSKDGNYRAFSKALYKDAKISVKGQCSHTLKQPLKLVIKWKLKYTQCADIFMAIQEGSLPAIWDQFRKYEIHGEDKVFCNSPIHLADQSSQKEYIPPNTNNTLADAAKSKMADEESGNKKRNEPNEEIEADGKKHAKAGEGNSDDDAAQEDDDVHKNGSQTKKGKEMKKVKEKRSAELKDEEFKTLLHVKRDEPKAVDDSNEIPDAPRPQKSDNKQKKQSAEGTKSQRNKEEVVPDTPKKVQVQANLQDKANETKVPQNPMTNKGSSRIAVTKRDGIYILIMTVDYDGDPEPFHLDLDVSMESKSGYLSATDWPLLPFYGIMSLVYLFYGIVWLIVSACQWRDLLRIQFWIGGVIALGMLEKAVFYSEYNNINNTGITTPSLVVFAEIVSVAKRTLARMLVIIVSMGFGIVKPRLGKSLHRVLGVGALYFILGIVEGCLRSLSLKADPSKEQLIAGIPLAVLDAAICWWIFMSLVQTTRTLRIRRNVIKLSLYRHFTNTLIFAVLASVAYMIWSIKTHKFAECLKDWSELWLDEAFWHFLFSIILLVIMVLWRPTANNQRYAFTPIVDFDDDEEDNVTLSEAFDGMKMRNTRTEVIVNGDSKHKAEDDLKWVEENIPSSAADTVLPSVLDSDEELMTTKFEMSKME